jgi:Ca-activated chloride channel family protein
MRWGYLEYLWICAAPVLVLLLYAYGNWRRKHQLKRAGDHALVEALLKTLSPERRIVKRFCFFFAIALLTLAALRPQYGQQQTTVRKAGIDVAIAFDISKSMLARDVVPSRIMAARTALKQLLRNISGDRIALVPFAGISFVQSPLTGDQSAIEMYLDELNPLQMPVGGTNLAEAIRRGTALLTGSSDKGDRGARSRVVLLITDGEDNHPDRAKAAKAAAKKAGEEGVLVLAIAVGTAMGEPIPILDDAGNHKGYVRGQDGQPVVSKLNLSLLEELTGTTADMEAPRVFLFNGVNDVITPLTATLKSLQRSALEMAMRHRYNEKYQYLLFPAILLLLIEVLLSDRRRQVT